MDLAETKALLVENLREAAYPVFCFEQRVIPAASIWTASRVWVNYFRQLGIKKGDRVVVKLPDSPAFLAVIIASIWEEILLVILPPDQPLSNQELAYFDATIAISNKAFCDYQIICKDLIQPDSLKVHLRKTTYPAIDEGLFILRSSGSVSNGRWNVLSFSSVFSVLESHLPKLALKNEEIILSILPWHHSFGLILDLLPTLLRKVEVHRKPSLAKNITALIDEISELKSVRINGVPLLFDRLLANSPTILNHIHGGIIGGATMPTKLASALKGSSLQIGYGQTEASPGISLGEVGEFYAGCLGKPLGCEVRLDEKGHLLFKGENAFLGYWNENGLNPVNSEFIATGDLVSMETDGSMTFQGRIDDRIKLLNGREISPLELEEMILEKFSELEDACLIQSTSSDSLILLVLLKYDLPITLDQAQLKLAIGSVAKWIKSVFPLTSRDWSLTQKGDKDRKKLRYNYNLTKSQ